MKLEVKKVNRAATFPTKAYKSAGYDLYSIEDVRLDSEKIVSVKTGIAIKIPEGYVGLIWDKSSRGKQGVKVYGGVIDADFRGEIEVMLGIVNKYTDGQTSMYIPAGSKVAQLLIQKVEDCELIEVAELDATERGEKGFGSSGL
jgi:dUTP pyrophosphatase